MSARSFTFHLLLPLFLLLSSACTGSRESTSDKPVISVSILPQEYFIRQLAGDLVDVNVMVPQGGSPATYEPTVAQLGKLSQSVLYLRIGYIGFELTWMEKIKAANPLMDIVNLSRGITPIVADEIHSGHDPDHEPSSGQKEGIDPHIWLSSKNARVLAQNTHAALLRVLPEYKDTLDMRLKTLEQELINLDLEISAILGDDGPRAFMIYHPALAYFARDYGLEQHSLEFGGKEPSPAHVKELADLGQELGISTIFVQKEFDQKNARVLADEIDARVQVINPLDPDWKTQMLKISNSLKEAL